jgi:hypothetical protein
MSPGPRLVVIVLATALSSVVGADLALRRAVVADPTLRAIAQRERRSFVGPLPGEGGTREPAAVLVGSSLSGAGGQGHLAARLESRIGRPVLNDSRIGVTIGDVLAGAHDASRRTSAKILVEVSGLSFNARSGSGWGEGDPAVYRYPRSALPLFRVGSWTVRRAILHAHGLEDVLADALRRPWFLYDFSRATSAIRRRHVRTFLHGPAPPPQKSPRQLEALARGYLIGKNFHEGIDEDVFRSLLELTARSPRPGRFVIFFPPLSEPYLRRACADGGRAWRGLERWVARSMRRCRRAGLGCVDLTHALDGVDDAFIDYGHVHRDRAFPRVAALLARGAGLE